MLWLMNSAMMPTSDMIYYMREVSPDEFAEILKVAYKNNKMLSRVGYEKAAEIFEGISGVPVPVSRDVCTPISKDIMLIGKLNYRLANPSLKKDANFQDSVNESDYSYYAAFVFSPQDFLSLGTERTTKILCGDKAEFIAELLRFLEGELPSRSVGVGLQR